MRNGIFLVAWFVLFGCAKDAQPALDNDEPPDSGVVAVDAAPELVPDSGTAPTDAAPAPDSAPDAGATATDAEALPNAERLPDASTRPDASDARPDAAPDSDARTDSGFCVATADFESREMCFDEIDNNCDGFTDRGEDGGCIMSCRPGVDDALCNDNDPETSDRCNAETWLCTFELAPPEVFLQATVDDWYTWGELTAIGTIDNPVFGNPVIGPVQLTAIGGDVRLTRMWWANNPAPGDNTAEDAPHVVDILLLSLPEDGGREELARGPLVEGLFDTPVGIEIREGEMVEVWFAAVINNFAPGETSGELIAAALYGVSAVDAVSAEPLAPNALIGVPSSNGDLARLDEGLLIGRDIFHRSTPGVYTPEEDLNPPTLTNGSNTVASWHVRVHGPTGIWWRQVRLEVEGTCNGGQRHVLECIGQETFQLMAGQGGGANPIEANFAVTIPGDPNDIGEIVVTLVEEYYSEAGVNDRLFFYILAEVSDIQVGDLLRSRPRPEPMNPHEFADYPFGSIADIEDEAIFVWTDEGHDVPEEERPWFTGLYGVFTQFDWYERLANDN